MVDTEPAARILQHSRESTEAEMADGRNRYFDQDERDHGRWAGRSEPGWGGHSGGGMRQEWEEPSWGGHGYPPGQRGWDTGQQPRWDAGPSAAYEMSSARHQRQQPGGYPPGYDPRYADPRYEEPRYDDPRQADPRYADPRYDELRYGGDPRYEPDPRLDTRSHARGYYDDGREDTFLGGAGYRGEEDGRGRRARKAKKKRRGRSFLALFMTLLLLGALGGGAYFAYDKVAGFFITPDYDGTGTAETVQIEVKKGELLGDIGNKLVAADVVKSYQAFVEAADANKDAKNIQPGLYTLRKQMSGKAAVAALLDPKNRDVKKVTLTEGQITLDIYAKLSAELKIPVKNFQDAAKDPAKFKIPDWWFKRNDGKQSAKGIEGFLFPDTYQFPSNVTAEGALRIMIDQFLTVTGELGFADNVQKNLKISPYEALIAASIVQAEAGNTKDMPGIARVLYNRAYVKNFPCKCLEADVTTNYWFRLQGKKGKTSGQFTDAELYDTRNPYRTHAYPSGPPAPGMPLGPIANPGKAALQAAMSPAKGDWLFFVTIDKAGNMAFATTVAQHDANIRKACQNGVPLC